MSGTVLSFWGVNNLIRERAAKAKGHCTAAFCQADEPMCSLTGAHPDMKAGVCQALVNRWIAAHAQGGSLWNTLFHTDSRGRAGGLNRLLFSQIIAEQRAGEAPILSSVGQAPGSSVARGGAYAQIRNNGPWLARQGLLPWASGVQGTATLPDALACAHALCVTLGRYRPTNGAYLNIALQGAGKMRGHAICAFIGGLGSDAAGVMRRDYMLFDPNIGEFWFEDRVDFLNWLKNGFLTDMRKYHDYDFTSFSIAPYAMRAGR